MVTHGENYCVNYDHRRPSLSSDAADERRSMKQVPVCDVGLSHAFHDSTFSLTSCERFVTMRWVLAVDFGSFYSGSLSIL